MKKSFRVVILCALLALLARHSPYGRHPDMKLSLRTLSEHWSDVTDLDLAREYILERSPLIRRIIEVMCRSFGPNG